MKLCSEANCKQALWQHSFDLHFFLKYGFQNLKNALADTIKGTNESIKDSQQCTLAGEAVRITEYLYPCQNSMQRSIRYGRNSAFLHFASPIATLVN